MIKSQSSIQTTYRCEIADLRDLVIVELIMVVEAALQGSSMHFV